MRHGSASKRQVSIVNIVAMLDKLSLSLWLTYQAKKAVVDMTCMSRLRHKADIVCTRKQMEALHHLSH